MTWATMVRVGQIVRPHGLRGHVVVEPDTDFGEDRFAPGATVWRQQGGQALALTVVDSRPQGERWIMRVDGVTTVEQAERLRGVELRISEADQHELGPDEYYFHDLMDCTVQLVSGEQIGRVTAVYDSAGGALLGVDREGEEVLIPLVKAMCPEVDVTAKRIVLDAPEGLLEVNRAAPVTEKRSGSGKQRR